MIENWKEFLIIEKELHDFLESISSNDRIKKALKYAISAGGKRIRPIIVLLAGKICNGDYNKLMNLAIAVELIHTASLIHDDVIDKAETRRGNIALNRKYNPSLAILLGDWLISKSVELTSVYGEKVIREFSRVGMMMSEGETMDLYSNEDFFGEKEYFECIEKKTASLFAYSAKTACEVSGGSELVIDSLYRYGYNLGIAYQLVDDLLEYLESLKDKKSEFESMTLPQIYERDFGREIAIQKTLDLILKFKNHSIEVLQIFPESEEKRKLIEIVDFMTNSMLKDLEQVETIKVRNF
ncbi:MAG: polyprenyl synthetase family protein [Archaeoglobaceae archaeon]|nr:polyprenyl synthetase family protein [Archaeoglobaceae archaeon]MDW8118844.1 polyprenyl synthetase family protein [Archaeoglobaceae archaeon]